jgi:hypothetical protein
MACNRNTVPAATVACTATTAKTVVGLNPASNICCNLLEALTSFDGATSSNAPAVCELNTITFATNAPGTNSSAVTPAKYDTGRGETVQALAGKTWTAEPTVHTQFGPFDLGQFNGIYQWILPFSTPLVIIGGKGVGIRITSPNNVNSTSRLSFEE